MKRKVKGHQGVKENYPGIWYGRDNDCWARGKLFMKRDNDYESNTSQGIDLTPNNHMFYPFNTK